MPQTIFNKNNCLRIFHTRSSLQSLIPLFSKLAVAVLVFSSLMLDSDASVPPSAVSVPIADTNAESGDVKIIFSDLDGTLIHYPKQYDQSHNNKNRKLLEFPPSSTGMVGVISAKTLSLVDEIRNQNNVKFVLVSGMRTSTLLQRLPYLPRADAYCSENGGRIFYPVEESEEDQDETKRIIRSIDGDDGDIFWVHPKRYKYDGNSGSTGDPHRNRPFGIREDKAWRQKMTTAMGGDSFGDFSLQDTLQDPVKYSVPLNQRDGLLWDFARDLMYQHDFVLDTKGYATCFRVNKKQQTTEAAKESSSSQISALLDSPQWNDGFKSAAIASSVNLSCVDFYPSCSGKKNCCLYLASKFFPKECQPVKESLKDSSEEVQKATAAEDFLSNHAVCICDDDNDLEMALACHHVYLPDISSESMRETIAQFPGHFTTTFSKIDESYAVEATDASDLALTMIWARTTKESDATPAKSYRYTMQKISVALCFASLFALHC